MRKFIMTMIAVLSCFAALLVVPEVRKILHLPSGESESPSLPNVSSERDNMKGTVHIVPPNATTSIRDQHRATVVSSLDIVYPERDGADVLVPHLLIQAIPKFSDKKDVYAANDINGWLISGKIRANPEALRLSKMVREGTVWRARRMYGKRFHPAQLLNADMSDPFYFDNILFAKIENIYSLSESFVDNSGSGPCLLLKQETKVSAVGVPDNFKTKASVEKPSQMTSEILSNNSAENEVLHDGILHIRVLVGSEPVKYTGYWVSCAKNQQRVFFDEGAFSKDVPIQDASTATINCRLDEIRWLADAQTPPLVMPRYNLEINGKVIPTKYAKQTTDINANYIVRLKRQH